MYKKYATLVVLCNMVLLMAWMSVQGIAIDRKVVEAFTTNAESQPAMQVTSFLGVTQEKISEQRILTAQSAPYCGSRGRRRGYYRKNAGC